MTQEGGDGAVVVKDSLLWEGRFAGFGTTKAGDGVNWWLVVADYNTPTLYTYAVDDVGISLHHVDTLVLEGYSFSSVEERDFSYVGFSPDGTQFLIYDEGEGIISLDFNRCEGSFSNAFFRAMPSMDRTNLAFSRNSRFAYINSLDQLLQVDLFSKEEGLLLDTIANWDGYYPPGSQLFFATRFGYSQLAPDGKIYISGTASGAVHIIERPNLPGQACGFRQVGFNLPVLFFNSIPHFPNYRLEPLDCD
jgi:hypothetical protein